MKQPSASWGWHVYMAHTPTSQPITEGSRGRNPSRNAGRNHGEAAHCPWTAPLFTQLLSCIAQAHLPLDGTAGVGGASNISQKLSKSPHRHAHGGSSLPDESSLCQVDKKLTGPVTCWLQQKQMSSLRENRVPLSFDLCFWLSRTSHGVDHCSKLSDHSPLCMEPFSSPQPDTVHSVLAPLLWSGPCE